MVAHLQGGYRGADPGDGAGGFVAEDHRVLEDEAADGAVGPVVDLGEVVRMGEEGEEEGKKEGGEEGRRTSLPQMPVQLMVTRTSWSDWRSGMGRSSNLTL